MSPSAAGKSAEQSALQHEQQAQQECESNKARVSLLVDKDCLLWAFPWRKFAPKPCTSACKRPAVCSFMYGRDFTPTNVASKHHQPKNCGPCLTWGDCMFGEPFRPKLDVVWGQGRVDCCGRVPGVRSNPRNCPQDPKDQGWDCPLPTQNSRWSRLFPSSLVHFPCICPFVTRGNKEGSCFAQSPKQGQARSSPLLLMELKFKLDIWLTVSCVVAVVLAYSLAILSIALNSILLAFGNAIILLLILFALFWWREILGTFGKKRSMAK